MNDADAVSGAKCLKGVSRVSQCLGDRERSLCGQQLAQIGSVNQLHHEEALPGDDALIENGHDTRVNDASGGARLAAETRDKILGVCQVGMHDLEGDGALQALVLGDVHGCHATAR